MNKKIASFALLITFFTSFIYGQSTQLTEIQLDSVVHDISAVLPVKNIPSCKANIIHAHQDIQKNSIRYQFQGITGPDQPAYLWIMRNEYHINVKPTNAVVEEGMCYNYLINNELAKKYGENIWDEINRKAENINNSGIGGSALTKFISKNLNMLDVQPSDAIKPVVEILCETNSEGKLVQCQVMQSYSEKFDNEAVRVMKLIPKWRPIPQKMTITVTFDPTVKNEEE
jgi:hypothetical protein